MKITIPTATLPAEGKPMEPKANGAPIETENPQEVFSAMDKRDEVQIVESLKGNYLDEYVFEFCRRHRAPNGGRPDCGCTDTVTSLSLVGILEASRAYGGIQIPLSKVVIQQSEDSVQVLVEAFDSKTGSSRVGVASQSKTQRLKSGAVIADEFYLQKAIAKAQRNSLRQLLPVSLIKSWIEQHRKGNGPALIPHDEPTKPPLSNGSMSPSAPVPVLNGTAKPAVNGASNGHVPARVGYPSLNQCRRIFGIAAGHHVPRAEVFAYVEKICGVKEPIDIPTRELYEKLCHELELYHA
jgi:hypothetical protein